MAKERQKPRDTREPTSDDPPRLEIAIGRQIRTLRVGLAMTVADLAAGAGLSTGMLSKIENGSTSPSLATLQSLARALNVPASHLFSEERPRCSFVKAGQGPQIQRRGTKTGHRYNSVVTDVFAAETGLEPHVITLDKDAEPNTTFRHDGLELIYLLSGKLAYRHGGTSYILEPGDTLFFDASIRHGPENFITLPITYLSLVIDARG